jgi:hypothetical protein
VAATLTNDSRGITSLLQSDPQSLQAWIDSWDARRLTVCLVTNVAGTGVYGAAMGAWRAPLQALFVGIKFPLIILLTAVGNALLNGMLAPLLGLNISWRQSFLAILASFTMAASILASFSPLVAFVIWNAPPMSGDVSKSVASYTGIQLMHVAIIAFAGVTANLRLLSLLRGLSGSSAIARRVLLAWLAGNLFFGSQLSWILRPFIGSPGLAVQFLRPDAFRGNFYETVFSSLKHLFQTL